MNALDYVMVGWVVLFGTALYALVGWWLCARKLAALQKSLTFAGWYR